VLRFRVSFKTALTPLLVMVSLQDVYERHGSRAAARLVIDSLPGGDSRVTLMRAALLGVVGDRDASFDHLDRAITMRDPHLVYLAVHKLWDPLRHDPRMDERLARLGLSGVHA
jgi:hypothetical protein